MKPFAQLTVLTIAVCFGCGQEPAATQQRAEPMTVPGTESTQPETGKMANHWSFQDAPNTAVISLTRITNGTRPVLYVIHDEDGDWQFLDGGDVSEEDGTVISLKSIVERDPSIVPLADLPLGWAAERSAVGQAWNRYQK